MWSEQTGRGLCWRHQQTDCRQIPQTDVVVVSKRGLAHWLDGGFRILEHRGGRDHRAVVRHRETAPSSGGTSRRLRAHNSPSLPRGFVEPGCPRFASGFARRGRDGSWREARGSHTTFISSVSVYAERRAAPLLQPGGGFGKRARGETFLAAGAFGFAERRSHEAERGAAKLPPPPPDRQRNRK